MTMHDAAISLVIGVLLLVLGLTGSGAYWLMSQKCAEQWGKSGMNYEYGLIKGCILEVDGRWIPADAYRHAKD